MSAGRVEEIVNQLSAGDIKDRTSGIESCTTLFNKSSSATTEEQKTKLYSLCLSILKESNSKLVLQALECVQLFIVKFLSSLKNLYNISFDILFIKLGDAKPAIRMVSFEVVLSLCNVVGPAITLEKIIAQLNHRNINIRESLLKLLCKLHENSFIPVQTSPVLLSKLMAMLSDPQNSVRDVAIETIGSLHDILNCALTGELETAGVKYAVIKAIMDVAKRGRSALAQTAIGLVHTAGEPSPEPLTRSSAFNRRASSAGPKRPPSASSVMSVKDDSAVFSRVATPGELASNEGTSRFSPATYLSLLHDGETVAPVRLYAEKDFTKATTNIIEGLANTGDWTMRLKALTTLQGLVLGDGLEYDDFGTFLKSIYELMHTQILDLRSSICKEACRTVAVIARRMGLHFAPHAEIWLPSLLKQLPVKIAVMSSAADRCIAIIVSSFFDSGSSRVLNCLLEAATSKNPLLRKFTYEYLCFVCSLWKTDFLDKYIIQLKSCIKSGVSDADQFVRKFSRYIFAILRNRSWQAVMERFMAEIDPSAQRLLASELQQPSPDLLELYTRTQLPKGDSSPSRGRPSVSSEQEKSASSAIALPTRTPLNPARVSKFAPPPIPEPYAAAEDGLSDAAEPSLLKTNIAQKKLAMSGPVRLGSLPQAAQETPDAPMASAYRRMTSANEGMVTTRTASRVALNVQSSASSETTSILNNKLVGDGPKRVARPARGAPALRLLDDTIVLMPSSHHVASIPEPQPVPIEDSQEHWTTETVKMKASSTHWTERVKAFESIAIQLSKPDINDVVVSMYADLAIGHLEDSNAKVALLAIDVICSCISGHSTVLAPKLGSVLPPLFLLLGDKRPHIRDNVNSTLTLIRGAFQPIAIAAALCPRINEVSDRVKTAVLQFLGVAVPYCEEYFLQASNTLPFLNRLANIMGASGTRPSTALSTAGKRLLELVFNVARQVVCTQINLLNLTQQTLLKSLLSSTASDIHNLVAAAGRKSTITSRMNSSDDARIVTHEPTKRPEDTFRTKSIPAAISPDTVMTSVEVRDINWILRALSATSAYDMIEAGKELKQLAKKQDKDFWIKNCAQIVTVLLEAFNNAPQQSSTPHREPQQLQWTGFTPNHKFGESPVNKELVSNEVRGAEKMLVASKILLAIARYKGEYLTGFLELLVSRLCNAACYAPVAVTMHSKQILSAVASCDAQRMPRVLLPFVNSDDDRQMHSTLLALQVLIETVKLLSSAQLLSELGLITATILPVLSAGTVDIRKAVIFLLVEAYSVVGDALHPYIQELMTPAQKKLLTIYIDRRILASKEELHTS